MSDKSVTQEAAVASMYSRVDISGDGWEFHGPAYLAWRIKYYAAALTKAAAAEGSIVKNAVQMHALGKDGQTVARQIMDDEWHCGNEPHRFPIPHPHWTDQLLELAAYADSLPAASPLRKSALQLAQGMLTRAQEGGGQ
jgi:hypothetical protein